jgi:sorbitol-specific phosphotransferase system component IIBC
MWRALLPFLAFLPLFIGVVVFHSSSDPLIPLFWPSCSLPFLSTCHGIGAAHVLGAMYRCSTL